MRRSEVQWPLYVAPVVAVLFILPLVWVISASLREPGLPPPRTIEWVPDPITFSNYSRPFEILPFGTYVKNSLIVTLMGLFLTLITASWAAFGMAASSPRVSRFLVVLSIVILLIPNSSLWLTRFIVFKWLGIIDTYWALIAPAFMGTSPLFILLFYWSFRRIPTELIEAVRLDGAKTLKIWWSVLLPLSKPAVVAVAILSFITYWSDFISPLLYLKSQDLYTLPIGIQQLQQLDRTNWPILMAACMILILPAVGMFLIIQKGFLGDQRSGSVLN